MRNEDFSRNQAAVLNRYEIDADERWIEMPTVAGEAHVLVSGTGPPVVMLNGIGVPAAMMAPLMAGLRGVQQYAVDLPGYGLTDGTPEFVEALRTNAINFLTELLDGLKLDRPVIVANSLGSLWASWFAIERPERVAGLIHVGCPALILDTSAPLPMRLLSVRPLGQLMMRLQAPSPRQVEQLSKMVNEDPLPADIAALILATERLSHFEPMFLATLNKLLRLRGSQPEFALTADQLSEIATPTMFVIADNDPMGSTSIGARAADVMPDATLHMVEGGHAPWIHHADQITPAINNFVDRVRPPGQD